MMRILGLDFGTKRIGVAVSDELLITAQAHGSIERKDLAADFAELKRIMKENGVTEIVIGLPLNMDGTHSAKTKETIEFMDRLAKTVDVPIRSWDERLTSLLAERLMLEGDISRRKRKKLSDKLAAQLILQNYLDFKRKE